MAKINGNLTLTLFAPHIQYRNIGEKASKNNQGRKEERKKGGE